MSLLVPIRSAAVALVLAWMVPATAQAALYCVHTAQQLAGALTVASDNGVDDEIRITTGTKLLSPAPNSNFMFSYASTKLEDLLLSGGWNSGCTEQSLNPRATRLSGDQQMSVLSVHLHGAAGGTVEIRNLSFYDGKSLTWEFGAGLVVVAANTAAPIVIVDRVVHAYGDFLLYPLTGTAMSIDQRNNALGQYTLRNLVFENNRTRALTLWTRPNSTFRLNNSTVTSNLLPQADQASVWVSGGAWFWMANNVLAGNATTVNLELSSGVVSYLRNNHIEGIAGSPSLNVAMTTGDPKLALDANGWWRPLPGSPLRDSGFATPNGGTGEHDITGGARVLGTAVDRGAVEATPIADAIFGNGFQLP